MSALYIGIMSGTSLDGIDLVLAQFENGAVTLLDEAVFTFPESLKPSLLLLSQGQAISLESLGTIDHLLGLAYADTVNQFLNEKGLVKEQITAIGCHGQTVFHKPTGPHRFSMQLGDANLIAALTGITTVADFRRKDMAFGGQGAPLVPAFHQFVFSDPTLVRVVLNIGGIANITVLEPEKSVIGFDTGPGNMLMDAWILRHLGVSYDKNGEWAQTGKVHEALLVDLLSEPYFDQTHPKSTGRELFHLGWLDNKLSQFTGLTPEDVQATLLKLTVDTIAKEVRHFSAGELLVCGGGAQNKALMSQLAFALPRWHVMKTDEKGLPADGLEALAFAWLAKQCLEGKNANLPSVTGASRACRLGAIYYPD